MITVSRLLKLWLVGKTFSATTPLFMRLLMSMAAIALLAGFAAVVMAMLLSGIVWMSYEQLVAYGLTQQQAILTIGAILLVILAAAALQIRAYCTDASRVAKRIMQIQSPVSTRVHSLSEAFMHGYNGQ